MSFFSSLKKEGDEKRKPTREKRNKKKNTCVAVSSGYTHVVLLKQNRIIEE
jgi:hypothetical protein